MREASRGAATFPSGFLENLAHPSRIPEDPRLATLDRCTAVNELGLTTLDRCTRVDEMGLATLDRCTAVNELGFATLDRCTGVNEMGFATLRRRSYLATGATKPAALAVRTHITRLSRSLGPRCGSTCHSLHTWPGGHAGVDNGPWASSFSLQEMVARKH